MSGLEFNGSYKKIPSFDFSTEFYGLASKVWVLMKAMEPKGKRLNVKFKKKKKKATKNPHFTEHLSYARLYGRSILYTRSINFLLALWKWSF